MLVVWIRGLSGAGKTTLTDTLMSMDTSYGKTVFDSDQLRPLLSPRQCWDMLGAIEAAKNMAKAVASVKTDGVVLIAMITPDAPGVRWARDIVTKQGHTFISVHLNTPLGLCKQRSDIYERFSDAATYIDQAADELVLDGSLAQESLARTLDGTIVYYLQKNQKEV